MVVSFTNFVYQDPSKPGASNKQLAMPGCYVVKPGLNPSDILLQILKKA